MITLFTFGPYFGLPDGSPFVIKAMLLLKFAGLAYSEDRGGFRKAKAKTVASAPQGFSPIKKSLPPKREASALRSAITRPSRSARVWRKNPCIFNVFSTLRRIRPCTIGRNGIGTALKNWAGPLAIGVFEPARCHQGPIEMLLAHFFGRPGACPLVLRQPGIEIETVFFLDLKANEGRIGNDQAVVVDIRQLAFWRRELSHAGVRYADPCRGGAPSQSRRL
jgi:hypothetical protein